jgi:hypothetical protein
VVLHLWLARVASGGRWRTDGLAQVETPWTVREGLRLAAGARGLVAGLDDAASVEVRAVGWLEAGWSPGAGVTARLRYELWTWPLGPAPSPNPEHRGLLDLTVAWEGGRPGAPAPAPPSGASPPRSSR